MKCSIVTGISILIIRFAPDIEYSQSLKGFIQMMKLLRVVFLQDSCVLMESYVDCAIFNHSIFKNPLFIAFKREVNLLCVSERQNPAHRIENTNPQVAEAIKHLHQETTDSFLQNTQLIRNDLSQLGTVLETKLTSAIDNAIRNIQFNVQVNSGTTGSSHNLPLSNEASTSSSITSQNECNIGPAVVQYQMSRSTTSVSQLWNEWHNGLGGQRSVKSLEAEFSDKWRGGSKSTESKFYNGRKLVIKLIECAVLNGSTLIDAIRDVEVRRVESGSMNKLVQLLRKEKRNE